MKGPLSAKAWNGLLDWLSGALRNRILSVTTIGRSGWQHPWFITPKWNGELKQWQCTIKPGFVNDDDVTVLQTVKNADGSEVTKDVPLTDVPSIPLTSFRSVGTDAVSIDGSGEGVPEFFAARGVGNPISLNSDSADGIQQQVEGLLDQSQARILRGCDLVLYHDRVATATDWQITPAEIGAQAQFTVIYKSSPSARTKAYIRTKSRYQPIAAVDDMTRLQGAWEDETFDSTLLATVWLLSPPGAAFDSEPDGSWQGFAENQLFWNADYETDTPSPGVVKQNLEVNLAGLGAAAGAQLTVNQILSSQNDAFNNALEFLTKKQITGRIRTPGHRMPPKWDKTKSLNPPFPYKGLR